MTGVQIASSSDQATGEVYVPPRRFASDGSLRPCEESSIAATGVLRAMTAIAGQGYGLIDLDHDVRVQVRIAGTDHRVGEVYEGRYREDVGERDGAAQIGDLEFHRA